MIKFGKLIDIVPYFLVGSVKNMCSVPMYLDVHHRLRIDISGYMLPSVNHEHASALLPHLTCKYGTEQAGAYYQIIVLHQFSSTALYFSSCA